MNKTIIVFVLFLLVVPLVSAGFFADFFGRNSVEGLS